MGDIACRNEMRGKGARMRNRTCRWRRGKRDLLKVWVCVGLASLMVLKQRNPARGRGGRVSFVRGPRRDLMEKEGKGKREGGGEEI